MKQIVVFFILLFFGCQVHAQEEVQGKVINNSTKEPLAFVNVVYGNPPRGTTTNIDGKFTLTINSVVDSIEISYVGYYTEYVSPEAFRGQETLEISLQQKMYALDEVVVKPGENPANRIIRKVYQNQEENNPKSLSSFSYRTYNKMVFTFDTTYIQEKSRDSLTSRETDSSDIQLKNLIKRQHLFLTESVTRKKFLAPDKGKEKVLASRVSGFKDPSLVFLATQMQSFSFYESFIQIGDYNYLNPISKHSEKKYVFRLEDTLYTERMDTVYVISFRPGKNKNFDGLKGMLHVNTNNYALQTVIAEPSDPPEDFTIRVQQKYEFIQEKQWFPTQLNTRIEFHNVEGRTNHLKYNLIGDGKTYLRNIKLNPSLDPAQFGHVDLNIPDTAYNQDNDYWKSVRANRFTKKELRTYEIIDSLGEKHNFDRKLKTFQVLSQGYYPVGFLNLDIRKFIGYNEYEGWRFGAGVMTNDKLSSLFSVGGYLGYGLRDDQLKYGGKLLVDVHEKSESQIDFSYSNDVIESGGYSFLDRKKGLMSSELYRDYMVESMFTAEKYEGGYSVRAFEYLKLRFFMNHSLTQSFQNYAYQNQEHNFQEDFTNMETGVQFKYAYGEKFTKTPWGKFSQGTDYPVFYGNIKTGLDQWGGAFDYTKFEGRIQYDFLTRNLGSTQLNVMGGMIRGEAPIFLMYNGHGSYAGKFTLQVDNSFATMRMNEFYADQFISLFFKHNFGSLLLRSENFAPRISLVTNLGWGTMEKPEVHKNIPVRSFSKGFYESGLVVDNILAVNFFSYGFGIYYRYGPYAFDNLSDNLAYKFSLRFTFETN